MNETLRCSLCGINWRRPVTRGRKPTTCPSCKANPYVPYWKPAPTRRPNRTMGVVKTDGGRTAAGISDKNDCTVRALATATGAPYEEAHAFYKRNGRRLNKGVNMQSIIARNDFKILGHFIKPMPCLRAKGLRTFLARNPWAKKGTYIVHMTAHAATLKDGKLLDSFDSSTKVIRTIYKVTPLSEYQ